MQLSNYMSYTKNPSNFVFQWLGLREFCNLWICNPLFSSWLVLSTHFEVITTQSKDYMSYTEDLVNFVANGQSQGSFIVYGIVALFFSLS